MDLDEAEESEFEQKAEAPPAKKRAKKVRSEPAQLAQDVVEASVAPETQKGRTKGKSAGKENAKLGRQLEGHDVAVSASETQVETGRKKLEMSRNAHDTKGKTQVPSGHVQYDVEDPGDIPVKLNAAPGKRSKASTNKKSDSQAVLNKAIIDRSASSSETKASTSSSRKRPRELETILEEPSDGEDDQKPVRIPRKRAKLASTRGLDDADDAKDPTEAAKPVKKIGRKAILKTAVEVQKAPRRGNTSTEATKAVVPDKNVINT